LSELLLMGRALAGTRGATFDGGASVGAWSVASQRGPYGDGDESENEERRLL